MDLDKAIREFCFGIASTNHHAAGNPAPDRVRKALEHARQKQLDVARQTEEAIEAAFEEARREQETVDAQKETFVQETLEKFLEDPMLRALSSAAGGLEAHRKAAAAREETISQLTDEIKQLRSVSNIISMEKEMHRLKNENEILNRSLALNKAGQKSEPAVAESQDPTKTQDSASATPSKTAPSTIEAAPASDPVAPASSTAPPKRKSRARTAGAPKETPKSGRVRSSKTNKEQDSKTSRESRRGHRATGDEKSPDPVPAASWSPPVGENARAAEEGRQDGKTPTAEEGARDEAPSEAAGGDEKDGKTADPVPAASWSPPVGENARAAAAGDEKDGKTPDPVPAACWSPPVGENARAAAAGDEEEPVPAAVGDEKDGKTADPVPAASWSPPVGENARAAAGDEEEAQTPTTEGGARDEAGDEKEAQTADPVPAASWSPPVGENARAAAGDEKEPVPAADDETDRGVPLARYKKKTIRGKQYYVAPDALLDAEGSVCAVITKTAEGRSKIEWIP